MGRFVFRCVGAIPCISAVLVFSGCAGDVPSMEARRQRFVVTTGADGWSEPMEISIPEGSRAVHFAVRGEPETAIGLGELVPPGGTDLVRWPRDVTMESLRSTVQTNEGYAFQGIDFGEGFYQVVFLEAFALTWPYAPGMSPPAGEYRVRFVTSRPNQRLVVRVIAPEEDETARYLHVAVHNYSGRPRAEIDALVEGATAILAGQGVNVVVDSYEEDSDSEFRDATCPDGTTFGCRFESLANPLRALWRRSSATIAVHLVVSERRAGGGNQTSNGVPVVSDGCTWGAATSMDSSGFNPYGATELAHEWGHTLGLHHPDLTGMGLEDPIPDTAARGPNLMSGVGDFSETLTPGQREVAYRSPLLTSSREPTPVPADCGAP